MLLKTQGRVSALGLDPAMIMKTSDLLYDATML
jgi:hypothetical protein